MKVIPCSPNGQARWTQRTSLGGRDYELTFDWNQRDGHWWLLFADQDGAAIASVKLVAQWPLLRSVTDARRPPGELALLDTQTPVLDPTFGDLGGRWQLVYIEPGDTAP